MHNTKLVEMIENFSERFFLMDQQMDVSGKRIINKSKGTAIINQGAATNLESLS